MAEPKRKHAPKSPRVFDVSRPGKSAPSHTAKPVIVSNRPVLRDPMVNAAPDTLNDSDETPAEQQPISHSGKIVIKPLDESLKAEDTAEEKSEKSEPEAEPGAPKLPPMPTLPVEEKEPAAAKEEPLQAEPAREKEEKPSPSEEEPAASETPETKEAEKAEPEPAKQPETTEDEGKADEADSAEPEAPIKDAGGKKPTADTTKEAAAADAAHDAEIHKLVESREYYLPINAVEKRRAKRFVALGIVLAVILALAWIDVALDAGLIHLGGLKAVTHFFSH